MPLFKSEDSSNVSEMGVYAKKKKKKTAECRKKQKARIRGKVRSTPIDDVAAFANPNEVLKNNKGKKKRILVIHGDPSKPNPILPGGKWDEDDYESIEVLKKALEKLSDDYEYSVLSNHDNLLNDLQQISKKKECDIVLQLCDEGFMNNPKMELHITAFLEMVGIPYTGTGPVALGLTYDKQLVVEIAKSLGISVPKSVYISADDEAVSKMKEYGIEYPVFVKPNSTDGSYGITNKSICQSEKDLKNAISMIRNDFHIIGPFLVQEYLEGIDLNTAMIGNFPGKHWFLPVTEEDFSSVPDDLPKILGFEAKWDENSPYFRVGTIKTKSVESKTQHLMNEWTATLARRLGIRDYCRIDWKLDKNGNPRFLEINPNCGWSYDAHLQRMCALAGISYSEMIRKIIEAAEERLVDHAKKVQNSKYVNVNDVSAIRCSERQTNVIGPMNI